MVRFLLGVLFAFGLWWGYERFVETPVDAAGHSLGASAFLGAGNAGGGGTPANPDERAEIQPAKPPEAVASPSVGSTADLAAAERLSGAARDAAVASVVRAVRAAEGIEDALAALGSDNAFLRMREGRQLAIEVAGRIEQLPAWDAVRASTRLMEAAMRGAVAV